MIGSVLELTNNKSMKGMSLYLLQIIVRSSVSCKIYWTSTLLYLVVLHFCNTICSRKERKMEYKYDHIIRILLSKGGWIRVPLFLPRGQDGK